MKETLLVFIFGGIGSVLRYAVGELSTKWFGISFPWGTLIVNVIGCTLIGIFARIIPLPDILTPQNGANDFRLIFMTGLCGGFTTFSAFTLDAANLYLRGEAGLSIAYITASVVLSLLGVAIGLTIGKAFI
jgi:fluoride exporter